MPRKTRKTRYASLSLTDKDLEILDIYVNEKNYLSRSEAVRHAIQFSYDKEFPNYVFKTTPAGEFKKRKLEEIKTFEEMSPHDYADSLGATILTSQEGVKWAMFRQMGNSVKGFLVEDLKSLADNEGFLDFIQRHKKLSKELTVEDQIKSSTFIIQFLLDDYDIVYSNDTNKRDDDSHPGLSAESQNTGVEAERPSDSSDEAGPDSRVPAGEQGGSAGHFSDLTTIRPNTIDRGEDRERQVEAGPDSLSGTIQKLRSHSPDSG